MVFVFLFSALPLSLPLPSLTPSLLPSLPLSLSQSITMASDPPPSFHVITSTDLAHEMHAEVHAIDTTYIVGIICGGQISVTSRSWLTIIWSTKAVLYYWSYILYMQEFNLQIVTVQMQLTLQKFVNTKGTKLCVGTEFAC